MDSYIAIKVEHVTKHFMIPHENRDTLKERIYNLSRKRTYETFNALKDVSFEIKKGEFFGIIGRNGSGKSTLLKILAGIYTPDSGKVFVHGEISPFLELGVGFNPELSGRDNIFLNGTILGLKKSEIRKKFDEIVAFSELERFIDQKLKNYSSGMQVRLAFSIAIHSNKGILLMDEVLAVGDANFQNKCISEFNRYKSLGNTVLLVTHDIGTVQRYCDRAMLLSNGKIAKIGPSHQVTTEYMYQNITDEERRILEEKNREKQANEKNSV
jgi:ABC-type polysaccharide/polyol phosphate transport system ATPase subunit